MSNDLFWPDATFTRFNTEMVIAQIYTPREPIYNSGSFIGVILL